MTPIALEQLAQLLNGQLFNTDPHSLDLRKVVNGISIDSRTITHGDLFVAIQGKHFDGHDYIVEAERKGALAAIVERQTGEYKFPGILVEDTKRALQIIANWHRNNCEALVIGITGSVGKTTTRHMLYQMLSGKYTGCESPQNYNNGIGVPLSLLQMTSEHEFALIEMGSSASGEIDSLTKIAEPEIGILTEIGPAHLDGLGTLDQVIQEKGALLKSISRQGHVFLPWHLYQLPEIRSEIQAKVLTVGVTESCDIAASEITYEQGILRFQVDNYPYEFPASGRHWLNSALICIGLAYELDFTPTEIQEGLNRFESIPGRCHHIQTNWGLILDDTYNASPLSVRAGLCSLTEVPNVSQRIAVLGDMLGLAESSEAHHRQLGKLVARSRIDFLITYGSQARDFARGAYQGGMSGSRIASFESMKDLLPILNLWATSSSAVLVKGSHAMQMGRIVQELQNRDQTSEFVMPLKRAA